jgi:hypothetical protein
MESEGVVSFVVPEMPIFCDIWTGPWATKVLRHAGVACNQAIGKRMSFPDFAVYTNAVNGFVTLLLPAHTDVRDPASSTGYDVVEVGAGSGRWYMVGYVDDVGRGFSNLHRMAYCIKVCEASGFAGVSWPTPLP